MFLNVKEIYTKQRNLVKTVKTGFITTFWVCIVFINKRKIWKLCVCQLNVMRVSIKRKLLVKKLRDTSLVHIFWMTLFKNSELVVLSFTCFVWWMGRKNHEWVTFMNPWTGPKNLLKRHSIIIQGNIRLLFKSLIHGGHISFIDLCMQHDTFWTQGYIIKIMTWRL